MQSSSILFARQPIYDSQLNITAYELLFRPSQPAPDEWDGDAATSQLVVNAFSEFGIDKAADNKQAFINFTRNWLLSPPPFDAQFVTVEILESVEPDAEAVYAARRLAQQGFTIALDDFVFDPKWHDMLQVAHIVKVDVLVHQGEQLETLVRQLAPYPVKLLAEKVENLDVFRHCKALGFDYFQGYFLCRPQNIRGNTLPPNKIVVMRLLAELQNPNVQLQELENIITNDIALSTRLLRICNTAHYATRVKIESIHRAMVLIGLRALKQWSAIIALSRLSDKPSSLVMLALCRARMMELVAENARLADRDCYFTVGMFSFIDAFFDQSKDILLRSLPFDDNINHALLHYEGTAGTILQAIEAHEQGNWQDIDWQGMAALGISPQQFEDAYIEALQWATAIMQSLLE